MIDNSIVKIIRPNRTEQKFLKRLQKINLISKKYPVYMGIDFEFNTKKVALMQILFEMHIKNKIVKRYYILYPPELSNEFIDYFKKNILANVNIFKILHGAESLDIPYIVNDLFDLSTETDQLINFFLSMVDTRYLCEYLNINESKKNICRIYDLLLDKQIITDEIKKKLEENEKEMGPIYEIIIDINTISNHMVTYGIHDVVYLVDLFLKLKSQVIIINPKDYYILLDCLRYALLEKREITNIGDDLIIINMMNNYFFYVNKTNNFDKNAEINEKNYYRINMLKTSTMLIDDFLLSYPNIAKLLLINYFRANILNLFRTIVYILILKYYKVKKSNTEEFNYKLDSKYIEICKELELLEFNYLVDLIKKFYIFVDIKLQK
jgi:hypothetical protein